MLVNVNGIYYGHVCEQARRARSMGNSAIENVCILLLLERGRIPDFICSSAQSYTFIKKPTR